MPFVKKTFKQMFVEPSAVSNACFTFVILQVPNFLELSNDTLSTPDLIMLLLRSVYSDIHCASGRRVGTVILENLTVQTEAAHLQEVCLPLHLFIVSAVTGRTDCGLLEGVMQGQGTGLLPAHCVQEVRLRQGVPPPVHPQPTSAPTPSIMMGSQTTSRVQGRRESMHKHFATAPRLKKQ
jgi:hypothetical protein